MAICQTDMERIIMMHLCQMILHTLALLYDGLRHGHMNIWFCKSIVDVIFRYKIPITGMLSNVNAK